MMSADMILFNGKIHTIAQHKKEITAVAIKDGRFMALVAIKKS
ncbi:hypothetical protein [Pedobacter sp. NJ-S-72]